LHTFSPDEALVLDPYLTGARPTSAACDRFLRLAGTADLQRSTAALADAAARLSRFFLMQTILAGCGMFGGAGL
jgi:hypothetical protein